MLLEEETECFCFLAGHESFAAAEGAIGIAEKANKVRQKPLRVILNGLGKDAAQIISRINGFTYVETEYDPYKNEVKEVYNLDEAYFLPIMHYLSMADTETTFHFEIKADLLSENTLKFLETVPEGRFQFEIGVQSTNQKHWKPSAGKITGRN